MADDKNELGGLNPALEGEQKASITWDDANMQTAFANVVNIQGTREQVELFFGTNRSWNPAANLATSGCCSMSRGGSPTLLERTWSV